MSPDNGYSSLLIWPDGHMESFARVGGPMVSHTWLPNWPQYSLLAGGTPMASDPVAAINPSGSAEVFAIGRDGGAYHTWFAPSSGWVSWSPLGGPSGGSLIGQAAVSLTPDGSLIIVARGNDRAYWYTYRQGSNWQAWASLGGSFDSDPVIPQDADGRLEVFGLSAGSMVHLWEGSDGTFSGWSPLGGSFQGRPAVARNVSGTLEIFALGQDGTVYHNWQQPSGWSGWYGTGAVPPGAAGSPALLVNPDGHLEVFLRGQDWTIWHAYQPVWGSWIALPGGSIASDPIVARESNTVVSVWAKGADLGMYEYWRPSNNVWYGWNSRGAPADTMTIGVPVYHQQHSLTCEESATSMALAYVGHQVTEQNVLDAVGVDRVHYWAGPGGGDPYASFVGNPDGSEVANTGYGVYSPPISSATTGFGGNVAQSGDWMYPSTVYDAARWGHPVVVWITYDWTTPGRRDYQAFDGRWVAYAGPVEHAMVVSGVSPDSVRVNDPDRGQYWVSKGQFEAAYGVYNQMAVVYF